MTRAPRSTNAAAATALLAALLAPAALATLAAPPAAHAQADSVVVDIDGLVFEEPDDRSRVVLRVRAGEELNVVSRSGKWIRVQLPRGTGWILARITRDKGGGSNLAGTGGGGADKVTVVDEYADVKAGPGDAYLGVKRVFKGDSFEVAGTNEDGTWVQVKIGGDLGWIRADQTLRADAVYDGGEGGGGPLGASEAFDEGDLTAPDPELSQLIDGEGGGEEDNDGPSGPGATGLTLRVGGLYQSSSQAFESDTTNFRLQQYETGSNLFGADLSAEYFFLDYVGAAVDYSFGFGTPITIPFEETGVQAELNNSTQRLHGRVIGRYPFGSGDAVPWVGGSVGGFYQQYDIQTTTIPVFLPNTYTGLRLGLDGAVPVGPVYLQAAGWFGLLGSVDQGELSSGESSDLLAFGGQFIAEYNLFGDVSLYARLIVDRAKSTFNGAATRDDEITTAVNRDTFLTISTGVTWRPL